MRLALMLVAALALAGCMTGGTPESRRAAIQNFDYEYKPYSLMANEPAKQEPVRLQTNCRTYQMGSQVHTDCR